MLSAAVDMLEHLGHKQHANLIEKAMLKTICEDKIRTPGTVAAKIFRFLSLYSLKLIADLGGTNASTEVVQSIIDHILQSDTRHW